MRRHQFLTLDLLLSFLAGCKNESPCYSGIVLGTTCLDGVLIQVTSAKPLGQPVHVYQTYRDSIVGTNVVVAINDLGSLAQKGQTVFFTYQNSPDNQGPARFCAQNTAPLPVPHLVLANVSGTACSSN